LILPRISAINLTPPHSGNIRNGIQDIVCNVTSVICRVTKRFLFADGFHWKAGRMPVGTPAGRISVGTPAGRSEGWRGRGRGVVVAGSGSERDGAGRRGAADPPAGAGLLLVAGLLVVAGLPAEPAAVE
jgi:hypothetical protein